MVNQAFKDGRRLEVLVAEIKNAHTGVALRRAVDKKIPKDNVFRDQFKEDVTCYVEGSKGFYDEYMALAVKYNIPKEETDKITELYKEITSFESQ